MRKPLAEWVGNSVRAHRTAHGLSQTRVASDAGCSVTTVQRLEASAATNVETLVRVCQAIGVQPSDVLRHAEQAYAGESADVLETERAKEIRHEARMKRLDALLDALDGVCENFDGLRAMVRAAVSEE